MFLIKLLKYYRDSSSSGSLPSRHVPASDVNTLIVVGFLLSAYCILPPSSMPCFSVVDRVDPSIWNGLPSQLRIFPRTLSPGFFLNLRLLFLAVLESEAPLGSSLEQALYKWSV